MVLTIQSQVTVPGLTGAEITKFLLECTDAGYQKWWRGVHLHLYSHAAGSVDHVGDEIWTGAASGSPSR